MVPSGPKQVKGTQCPKLGQSTIIALQFVVVIFSPFVVLLDIFQFSFHIIIFLSYFLKKVMIYLGGIFSHLRHCSSFKPRTAEGLTRICHKFPFKCFHSSNQVLELSSSPLLLSPSLVKEKCTLYTFILRLLLNNPSRWKIWCCFPSQLLLQQLKQKVNS